LNRTALLLLIVGLVVESAGYVLDKADFFGFVVPLVSPTFVGGQAATSAIRSGKVLERGSEGFDAAEYLFKEAAKRENPAERVDALSVLRFSPGGARLSFGKAGVTPQLPVKVLLSNGQELDWETGALERALDAHRQARLTLTSVVIFLFGICLQIVGFVVEQRNDQRARPPAKQPLLQPTSGQKADVE
jgi:hypothetical protein